MAELHVTGQLLGGDGFPIESTFCKWKMEVGPNFRVVQGVSAGQTQCDVPCEGEASVWAHPIDVHYALKGIEGWPRLQLEVFGVDAYGRSELCGYGSCMVPTSAGCHDLQCTTWRPCGTLREQLSTFFLGGNPRLKHTEIVTRPTDRFRLHTQPSGQASGPAPASGRPAPHSAHERGRGDEPA